MADADFSASKAIALLLAGADDLLDFVERQPRKAGGPFAAQRGQAAGKRCACFVAIAMAALIIVSKLCFCASLKRSVEVLERAADDLQTLQHGA